MEERASSSAKIELYGTKIKVGKVLRSVQHEVLEPSCIVLVQQINKLLGRLELCNCVLLCLFEKGPQLVVLLLKMVKTSILFKDIRLELFIEVSKLFSLLFIFV